MRSGRKDCSTCPLMLADDWVFWIGGNVCKCCSQVFDVSVWSPEPQLYCPACSQFVTMVAWPEPEFG